MRIPLHSVAAADDDDHTILYLISVDPDNDDNGNGSGPEENDKKRLMITDLMTSTSYPKYFEFHEIDKYIEAAQ